MNQAGAQSTSQLHLHYLENSDINSAVKTRMARLTILLLLVVCIHAALADFGGWKRRRTNTRWVKSGLKKLGVKASWERKSYPWNGKKSWERDGSEEGHEDFRKMRDEDESSMMVMRMKRMFKPLRDLFMKVLDLGPKETSTGRPAFCGGNECPLFKVLNKSEHYELRMYEPSQWVSTKMQAKIMSKTQSTSCFWRLFNYIQGNNELEQKIKMTVPVTRVFKKDPASGMTNITMSFYLPSSITNPPSPNEQNVWVKRKGNFKVYVHSFDGYAMSQKTWEKHVKMLQRILDKDGLSGKYHRHEEMYVTAGYDDPMKLFNRHNEVWLVAKDQEA